MQFDRMQAARRRADSFARTLDELCAQLAPWPEEEAAACELRDAYARSSRAFFDAGHTFSLAVIGQVKAGKSTFLNTLLFGGQDLLPQAASPKTAVLTRLEYAQEARLTVEYYTEEDWAQLRKAAAVPLESPAARGARDILRAGEGLEATRVRCAEQGAQSFACPDERALGDLLEQTAGGRGAEAPFVKSVTLGLCRDELRGVSVVDTPGLNDPVLSRSQRTREYLGACDAAFFLSHSGYFLDENDLALLASQLPQKGVRRLCLVASRFDGALALANAGAPADAARVRAEMTARAAEKLDGVLRTMQRAGAPAPVLEVVRSCRVPVFVSAAAHRMAGKAPEDYTPDEWAIAHSLFGESAPDAAALAAVGNFGEVRTGFDRFAAEKDATLAAKADSFAAVAQAEARGLVDELCRRRRARSEALDAEARRTDERGAQLAADARRIRAQSEALFNEYLEPFEALLAEARRTLDEMGRISPAPAERADVTLHSEAVTVSDATLWKPWTWGRKHREYSVHESARPYWEAQDTIDFLKQFPQEAALVWDGVYAPMMDTARLQNHLVLYARRALEAIGRPAQGEAVLEMVRRALAHICAPRMSLGTQALCESLRARFPERAANEAERAALEQACRAAADEAAQAARRALEDGAQRFVRTVHGAQEEFCSQLLAPLEEERRRAQQAADAARRERAHCQEFIETARRLL